MNGGKKRTSSTKGRHIVQVNPVRCDAGKPVASTSYDAGALADLPTNAAYAYPTTMPYLSGMPLPGRTSSSESLQLPGGNWFAPPAPPPSYTPTPPLSYSSAASPEESLYAHSPPDTAMPSISRRSSAFEPRKGSQPVISTLSLAGPVYLSHPHSSPHLYQTAAPQQAEYSVQHPVLYAMPASHFPSAPTSATYETPALSFVDPRNAQPAQSASWSAQPSTAPGQLQQLPPMVVPDARGTPSPAPHFTTHAPSAYPPKRLNMPHESFSYDYAHSYAQASAYDGGRSAAFPVETDSQPSSAYRSAHHDPTMTLSMPSGRSAAGSNSVSPFPLYGGPATGSRPHQQQQAYVQTSHPGSAPPSAGGPRSASTPGFGHVDEWLRGLAS
ncbi:hypothetical protein Rhopal_002281-T1 [Rhodotorula paludigena]|uniref:Proteophosphoglycan ppg4 n=1 Tax=Rhodotorula paludigena TaxID=86838 RepID=A0AAV5GA85_9BASI|nr:hypothetical protein Rhopal_002281-T1 [Rhodotorula paludigena]